jgi:nickel-dependent lactate racemase
VSAATSVRLPFGRGHVVVQVPSDRLVGIFPPSDLAESHDQEAVVREALEHPLGQRRLRDVARPGQKVAVVTSDATRPCPSHLLLPHVVAELSAAGVPDADIMIVMALGLHRKMSEDELKQTVGAEAYRRVRVINHDPARTVRVGVTTRGTPAEFLQDVVEADLRVCVGNVEFHYFAGYSGGAKAILPGCASLATVTANHAMMVRPEAVGGENEGNPVREDIEEAVAMVGVDFVLNVLVDAGHRVVAAVAGDVTAAHRKACDMVSARGKVAIPGLADVVLASAGGYPKDVNLYQAQKALDNAACAMRPGGICILVAECPEGIGNRTFEEWMTQGRMPQELLHSIQRQFVLGGHKAAAIAKVACQGRIFLVAPSLAGRALSGMEHYPDTQVAVDTALHALGPHARVLVLPEAGSVLPQAPGRHTRCSRISAASP